MLTPARPSRSLALFLLLLIGTGAILGRVLAAAGVALFVLLLTCLDAKPAWRWFYDPPGDVDSGRESGRFFSWRRLGPASPHERLPSARL
jgi:hypothetical protein